MKNFQSRDGRGGGFRGERGGSRDEGRGRPSFGDKKRGGDRGGDREAMMFQATCSDCKKNCDVPFRPANDKPVYCSSCFSAKRERDDKEYKAGNFNREPKRFGDERPAERAPFARPEFKPVSAPADDTTKKQLADISFKLDKLINAIEKMSVVKKETPVQMEVPVKAVVTEIAKAKVSKPKAAVVAKKATVKVAVKKTIAKVVAKTVLKSSVKPHSVATLRGARKTK